MSYQRQESAPQLKRATLYHAVRASVVDLLDKPVFVALRCGSYYVGILSSFDQYNSIVLTEASQRLVYENKYADKYIGTYVFRGENISLIGENNDYKAEFKEHMKNVSVEEIKPLIDAKKAAAETTEL